MLYLYYIYFISYYLNNKHFSIGILYPIDLCIITYYVKYIIINRYISKNICTQYNYICIYIIKFVTY